MQILWAAILRVLPFVALLGRRETVVHQNVPQWDGTARNWACHRNSPYHCDGLDSGSRIATAGCARVLWRFPKLPTSTSFRHLLATSATSCGFGPQSTTSRLSFWRGWLAIIVEQRSSICGISSIAGTVFSMSLMGGRCTRCLSKSKTTLLIKPIWLVWKEKTQGLRHYLARLHRSSLCYSKSIELLKCSMRLLLHYLKYKTIPLSAWRIITLAATPPLVSKRSF